MWIDLLEQAVDRHGMKTVAKILGYSPTSLSLIRNGKYPGGTQRIEQAVLTHFSRVQCPHLGFELGPDTCRANRDGPCPNSSPKAFAQWAACRKCPFNPKNKESIQ